MMKELHFRDILLLPKYSEVNSRSEVDTSKQFGKFKFKLPVVPANMKTVIDESLALWLAKNGYFYIMHRFGIDTISFIQKMEDEGQYISISIGVNEDSKELVKNISNSSCACPDYITIDIAHGHSKKMKEMISFVKDYLPDSFLIAGNTCTEEGTEDICSWGADSVKVGVGPGSVCRTKLETGFSRPQFSAVKSCSDISRVPVIADGGIEYSGDIAKALVAGASMVMTGKLLAGYEESPGKKIIHEDGRITKEYFGSASENNKGRKDHVEGCRIEIPYRGSIADKLKEIQQSLSSSVSYAGGHDLSSLGGVRWVENHPS